MTVAPLLDALEARGNRSIATIEAETAGRCAAIEAEAARAAADARDDAYATALAPLGSERYRLRQAGRLRVLQVTGRAREAWIDAILAGATERLAAVRDDAAAYAVQFGRLTAEALSALGADNAAPVLVVAAQDRALAEQWLAANARGADVSIETAPDAAPIAWGGVRARSADGRITVDNTLASRLALAQPYLREELARRYAAARADP